MFPTTSKSCGSEVRPRIGARLMEGAQKSGAGTRARPTFKARQAPASKPTIRIL